MEGRKEYEKADFLQGRGCSSSGQKHFCPLHN